MSDLEWSPDVDKRIHAGCGGHLRYLQFTEKYRLSHQPSYQYEFAAACDKCRSLIWVEQRGSTVDIFFEQELKERLNEYAN